MIKKNIEKLISIVWLIFSVFTGSTVLAQSFKTPKDSSNLPRLENTIHKSTLRYLKTYQSVRLLEKKNRLPKEEASFDRRGIWMNKISLTHQKYPSINGEGLFVSVKEQPFNITDIDFSGRIVDTTGLSQDLNNNHATQMASIIAGGGNTSPNSLGIAWKVRLYSASFDNLFPDNGTTLVNQGVYVQNHSYGIGEIENFYGSETQAYDQQGIEFPQILHVFSAGNAGDQANTQGVYKNIEGFANLTGQFKTSKNTLSIGEVDENGQITVLGSKGPTYDGRIKPELVAYGGAGTSESAAVVSGISLLVQNAYKTKHNQIPSASLVKAALINTADDLGRPAVDFEYGFGNVDALGAVETILENRYFENTLAQTNETKTFTIQVPDGAKNLKVTLVWNDPPASPNNTKALINDLDLTITETLTGNVWKPWVLNSFAHKDSLQLPAKREEDHLNNVEQVTLEFPTSGEYQITVKAFQLQQNNQSFSIAYEFSKGFTWVFPLESDVLQATRSRRIQWEWNKTPIAGKLEFKYIQENTWKTIAELSDLSVEAFNWSVPDTFALAQIRLSANDGFSFTSDTLTIMRPLTPNVGYDCPEEIMLYWEPLSGVTQYQVYNLGAQFLEPLVTVQDTLVVISKTNQPGRYFAVVPVLQNKLRRLGNTVNIDFSGVACYFRSVLLANNLADSIQLNVSLATTYRLKTIALQRRANETQNYQTIAEVAANQNTLVMSDVSPLPYRNMYRVALTDITERQFFSEEVNALVVAQNEFFLYPNPTRANTFINLVDRREVVEKVQIFNSLGKILQEYIPDGITQKEISTEGLNPGTYFVRFLLKDGGNQVKRLIVK